MSPLQFVEKVELNQLKDWFVVKPKEKRVQLAREISRLAYEQHSEGGVLSAQKMVTLPEISQDDDLNNNWEDRFTANLPAGLSPEAFGMKKKAVMTGKSSKTDTKVKTMRLCGLCREPGHTKLKCPMKI